MCAKWARVALLLLLLTLVSGVAWALTTTTEQEPNNTPAQANDLNRYSPMEGAIDPAGDVDYFKVRDVNDRWGMVALLDTNASTTSQRGVITAYAPDGVTLLQQDEAALGKKGLIAWQHFDSSNDREPHFLRVSEAGNNQTISQYTLRYYELSIGRPGDEHSEQEPNDSPASANTSARVNRGVISSAGDRDCYAVYAKAGQKFLYVLNADPEGDGGADFKLTLHRPDGSVWQRADRAGAAGNEYIDEVTIPEDGVYAYCVEAKSGAGANATYLAGPIRNSIGYEPMLQYAIRWDNPRPGNFARVGDLMHYTLTFTYKEPLAIPDEFRFGIYFKTECQQMVDAGNPDYQYDYGNSMASGWRYEGLSPNTTITKTVILRAAAPCFDNTSIDVVLDYYDTGWGDAQGYLIGDGYYLPLIMR